MLFIHNDVPKQNLTMAEYIDLQEDAVKNTTNSNFHGRIG